jgi:hypothetical protein
LSKELQHHSAFRWHLHTSVHIARLVAIYPEKQLQGWGKPDLVFPFECNSSSQLRSIFRNWTIDFKERALGA